MAGVSLSANYRLCALKGPREPCGVGGRKAEFYSNDLGIPMWNMSEKSILFLDIRQVLLGGFLFKPILP